MDLENAKAQMRKGVLEMCVLAVIAEGETYPPEIVEKLRGAELPIVEGTLYPLITRLKNDGLLDYVWRESEKGPPRKYYRVNDTGRNVLTNLMDSWNRLVHSVDRSLKGDYPAPSGGAPEMPKPIDIEPL
jgi:PadR family transcriptional regulator, regulatory protein PadR